MKYSYYPGCTLKNKARDLDAYARASAEALGFEMEEIEDWQCCGGVFVSNNDEIASKLSSVRALIAAKEAERPLVTVCSACHNVIKQTNYQITNDEAFRNRANLYLAQDKEKREPYSGETKVMHYFELLRDVVGFDKIKEKVVNPLTGRKIAAYYGCLLLRPSRELGFDDPENPSIIEDFIRAIGAEPVYYGLRNECCGGYVALEDPESAKKKSNAVTNSAENHGAELAVTACPLCKYNLVHNGSNIPVVYFTELLAEALGVKEDTNA